jgi:glycosyltransferase involved in cell wall biosynthesis
LPAPTLQYVHSRGTRAKADITVYCSAWLAAECGRGSDGRVLYQPVPKPPAPLHADRRSLRQNLRVGRLCTPTARKWPEEIVEFYRRLAQCCPEVDWEFVGCPPEMQGRLSDACSGRGTFIPASRHARSRMWTWDALLYHHPHLTESFGRTAAESMRAGCIPIVDGRGGFVEQVAEGTGFLCADNDDFCEALQSLSDPSVRLRMSRAAMAHADETFSLQRFRCDLLRLLAEFGANDARRSSLAGAAL